jgi:hypothetical protein
MQWVPHCAVVFSTSLVLIGACSDAASLGPRDRMGNGAATSTGGRDDDDQLVPGAGGRGPSVDPSGKPPPPMGYGGYSGYGGYGGAGAWGGYGGWATGGAWGTGGTLADGGNVCVSSTVQQWCAGSPWTCDIKNVRELCAGEENGGIAVTTRRCGNLIRFETLDALNITYDARTGALLSVLAQNPANGCYLIVGTQPACSGWITVPCWSLFPEGGTRPPPPPVDAGAD